MSSGVGKEEEMVGFGGSSRVFNQGLWPEIYSKGNVGFPVHW